MVEFILGTLFGMFDVVAILVIAAGIASVETSKSKDEDKTYKVSGFADGTNRITINGKTYTD